MSRSKRAAQAVTTPAPTSKNGAMKRAGGVARTCGLLALSVLAFIGVSLAMRRGLTAAFGALFAAWGVNADTAARAPGWARWLYAWHGSIVTALAALAALALSLLMKRLWSVIGAPRRFDARAFMLALAAGLGLTALIAALCLLPDSMRPEWPLSRPNLNSALPALCALSLLGVLAEEVFTKRVIYDALCERWGAGRATLCACAAALLVGSWPGSALAVLNALLLALACARLHARYGLWSAVGFRWGWSLANVFLLGFGGGNHAVYRLYGVSETALTGGDAGPICGLWATLALTALVAWLTREAIGNALRRLRKPVRAGA